jgi:polysaccharide export outer membrane protein
MQGGTISGAELQTYIIDKDGYIIFPVVGKIMAAGQTRSELQEKIKNEIYPRYIKEVPVINVRLKNFKIAVLGEVNRPGSFIVTDEQCTIFDALAMAGDLTIYGKRDNVKVLREGENGKKDVILIDLQNVELLYRADQYYLKQNDVIYVEPNKAKARAAGIGSAETFSLSIVSTMISIATLLITILR